MSHLGSIVELRIERLEWQGNAPVRARRVEMGGLVAIEIVEFDHVGGAQCELLQPAERPLRPCLEGFSAFFWHHMARKIVAGSQTASNETVGGSESVDVSGSRSHSVKDESLSVSGKRSQSIGKDDSLRVGQKLTLDAGDQVVLKAGSASITLKKNGEIVIRGKNLTKEPELSCRACP